MRKIQRLFAVLIGLAVICGTVSCVAKPLNGDGTDENSETMYRQTEADTKEVKEDTTAQVLTQAVTTKDADTTATQPTETVPVQTGEFLTAFEVSGDIDKDGKDEKITVLYNSRQNLVRIDADDDGSVKSLTLEKNNAADYYLRDPEPFYGVKQTTFADIDSDGANELIICTVNTGGFPTALFNVIDFNGSQPVEIPFADGYQQDGEARYVELLKAEKGENGVYSVTYGGQKAGEINAGDKSLEGGAAMALYAVKDGKLCIYTAFTEGGADMEVFAAYEITLRVNNGVLETEKAAAADEGQTALLRAMF